MGYHVPWGTWLIESEEDVLNMDLRLRCQGYTTALSEELSPQYLNWRDTYS